MSIKSKVTLYYSMVLIVITVVVFSVFFITADTQASAISKGTLEKTVSESFNDVEYENNILEIDNDFDIYKKGVTLVVYSDKGSLIKGSLPADFPRRTPLTTGKYQEIDTEANTWLVYDLYNSYENGQGVWVRGIYSRDNDVEIVGAVKKIMLIILPILLILAILAGRRITRKAFMPINAITKGANDINSGMDLSKRLPLEHNKDELYFLTETLNNMLSRLEDAFAREKEFSSDVSHELRTPLSVMLSECEYILGESRSNEEYRESLEEIQKQCKRTMSLIQQLLRLSRSVNTSDILEKENFDLSIICQSAVEQLQPMAESKGVQLDSYIEPDVMYYGDETMILRLILNLISNGIKYNKPGGFVKLILRGGQQPSLVVEDNGIGISEEDVNKIFNRFYKVDKSREQYGESFGLGLSMVKWIAEAHNGSINVESCPGEGSRFVAILGETDSPLCGQRS